MLAMVQKNIIGSNSKVATIGSIKTVRVEIPPDTNNLHLLPIKFWVGLKSPLETCKVPVLRAPHMRRLKGTGTEPSDLAVLPAAVSNNHAGAVLPRWVRRVNESTEVE